VLWIVHRYCEKTLLREVRPPGGPHGATRPGLIGVGKRVTPASRSVRSFTERHSTSSRPRRPTKVGINGGQIGASPHCAPTQARPTWDHEPKETQFGGLPPSRFLLSPSPLRRPWR